MFFIIFTYTINLLAIFGQFFNYFGNLLETSVVFESVLHKIRSYFGTEEVAWHKEIYRLLIKNNMIR